MTVTSSTARKSFTGDNATTSFDTSPMVFFDTADLDVYVTVVATGVTTTLVEGTDYTVSGGSGSTGTVSLAGGSDPWGALATGTTLAIVRDIAITQESDFSNNDTSDAEVVEDAFDRLTMIAQQNKAKVERTLRQPDGDVSDIAELPDVLERASMYLAFDSSGDPVAVDPATASGTSVTATGSTTARLLAERFAEWSNVKDFGAVGDGTTDDTTAIAAAITASRAVYFPPGSYKITSQLSITQNNQALVGAGVGLVTITMAHASNVAIKVTTSPVKLEIAGFTLTRSVTATSGGTGLDLSAVIGTSWIHDLRIDSQYIGMKLGPTDYGFVENVVVTQNVNIGISMTNTAANGSVQWDLKSVLSSKNGSHGISFTSTAGPSQVTMGEWLYVTTFANTGYGAAIVGTAGVPVHDVRMDACFFGSDAASEIYLDTYGRNHCIRNCFTEIAGTIATGPSLATAASNVGRGVEITANNVQVGVFNHHSSGNSQQGLVTAATTTTIVGGVFNNNGANGTAGTAYGVQSTSGRTVIQGITAGNTSGTTQKYGVAIGADTVLVNTCDLTGNGTNPIAYTTFPPVGSSVTNILPITEIAYPVNPSKSASYIWSRSPTNGIGYATGAGGTVNQGAGAGKATTVSLNKVTGTIVTDNANLNAGAEVSFTVQNTTVIATDVIVANHASGGTAGAYMVQANSVGTNTFNITITNLSAGNLAEALTLNFVVIKGVAA